jgi:hypothetical protein
MNTCQNSWTKLKHKTSLQSKSVRWDEVRVSLWTKFTDLESIRLNKQTSSIICYDVQTWHLDVFKQNFAPNAGSSSSSYWNRPMHGKWDSEAGFKEEGTTILVQRWIWSLLTASIFTRWNCSTEQIIPVRFTKPTPHLVDFHFNLTKIWLPCHKDQFQQLEH